MLPRSALFSGVRIPVRHISEGPPPHRKNFNLSVQSTCLFVARGVGRLGYEANKMLIDYFSNYGRVSSVKVACTDQLKASIAFILMSDPDEVSAVLTSPIHVIDGYQVTVQPYFQKLC
jgi:hypothetical protein